MIIGAALAMIGPTSQDLVNRLRPWHWLAPAGAVATVALLIKMADSPSYEFIYFHF